MPQLCRGSFNLFYRFSRIERLRHYLRFLFIGYPQYPEIPCPTCPLVVTYRYCDVSARHDSLMNVSGTWLDRVLLRIPPFRATCVLFLDYCGTGISTFLVHRSEFGLISPSCRVILLMSNCHYTATEQRHCVDLISISELYD